ncbi:MAG TPA: DedA family protein [Candidatus Paceibacterota bacterium]|nr:DedA family protein [Candidatus Paceibacterota bacterium]
MHIAYQSLSALLLYSLGFLAIFSESGIFFLFFLPGDSLLFAFGILANQHVLRLGYLVPMLAIAAVCGNFLGYFLGILVRGGLEQGKYLPKIKMHHLHKADVFYRKHGSLAILFARFIPVIRTFVPFFGGMVKMQRHAFGIWSIVGGIVWVSAVVLMGYFFGHHFNIHHASFLGTGVILAAAIATPVAIAFANKYLK